MVGTRRNLARNTGWRHMRRQQNDMKANGSHPDADRPLAEFQKITVACNDCGDVTVLEADQLATLSAVPTFGALWRHAFCRSCRDSGASGPASVTLQGVPRTVDDGPMPPWSTKPAFGDERSDPFPTLPKRAMFDREQ